MPETEADTSRRLITPALIAAGWDIHTQIAEQRQVTPGRVVVVGNRGVRQPAKRLDYLLRYTRDLPLAVVEAKASHLPAANGLQQAMEYATMLGVPFAYSTNGKTIIEHDFFTGEESEITLFPSPDDLWYRYKVLNAVDDPVERIMLTPSYSDPARPSRYYQTVSINRVIEAVARGRRRLLLTLATGTGKTYVAFQICWRLWNARWSLTDNGRRPRILYLADRNVLLDQPMLGVFAPFGDAIHRISDKTSQSREVYFTTYQQIADSGDSLGQFRQYADDFFDLIIVDECHRGSAKEDSPWKDILNYFDKAAQLGMTATPMREESRDTYAYFGTPLVEYSLADGIEDGFLAPYKVHRVTTDIDLSGFRPAKGQTDRYGNVIPDRVFLTGQFERILVMSQRTRAMAEYLLKFLDATDSTAKTIVFCVDQEHALAMRNAIAELATEKMKMWPAYVARITSDEGTFGRTRLDEFQDIDSTTPVIVTSSDMLTTGVDAPTVKNIVLCRGFGSLSQFKQVIGRGTRLRTDYGKWFFTILDFTGVATRMFADPSFDGEPTAVVETSIDAPLPEAIAQANQDPSVQATDPTRTAYESLLDAEADQLSRKLYVDDEPVEIVADVVYHLGLDGRRLHATALTDYTRQQLLSLVDSPDQLGDAWRKTRLREDIVSQLELRGIDLAELARAAQLPDADPFDLLCYIGFDRPVRTRAQRAAVARDAEKFWEKHAQPARDVLMALLDKYERYGVSELQLPGVLRVAPLSEMGNVIEISERFGGVEQMKNAFDELQNLLYTAA